MFNLKPLANKKNSIVPRLAGSEFFKFLGEEISLRLQALTGNLEKILLISPHSSFWLPYLSQAVPKAHITEQASLEAGPKYSQQFDAVIAPFCLQYVSNLPDFFYHIKQHLQSHGFFLAHYPINPSFRATRRLLISLEEQVGLPHHSHFIPMLEEQQAAELWQQNGFSEQVSDFQKLTIEQASFYEFLKFWPRHGLGNYIKKPNYYTINKALYNLIQNYSDNYSDTLTLLTTIGFLHKNNLKLTSTF